MLKTEEYQQLEAEKMPCPYGRKATVGDKRCINCHFNKFGSYRCDGSREAVRKLQQRLQLDY